MRLVVCEFGKRFEAVAGAGAETVEASESGEGDGDGGLERGDPHEIGVSHFSGTSFSQTLDFFQLQQLNGREGALDTHRVGDFF